MKLKRVLTVCAGNICRSPMAEHWLRGQLHGLDVSSAGLTALVGQPIDPGSQHALQQLGMDASEHRARQLAEWMVDHASLILVAELRHKQHIERLYPQARGRVFRMGEAQQMDIADPYRHGREHHSACLHSITQGLTPWAHRIRSLGYESLQS